MVTDYGSVHWGVNLGVGWKAATNYAFPEWLEAAREVDAAYCRLEAETGQTRHDRCVPPSVVSSASFTAQALSSMRVGGPRLTCDDAASGARHEAAGAAAYEAALRSLAAGALPDQRPPPHAWAPSTALRLGAPQR